VKSGQKLWGLLDLLTTLTSERNLNLKKENTSKNQKVNKMKQKTKEMIILALTKLKNERSSKVALIGALTYFGLELSPEWNNILDSAITTITMVALFLFKEHKEPTDDKS